MNYPGLTSANRQADFDPEDDSFRRADEDDSEVEEPADGDNGREHYETVGKSRLRKPEQVSLGAKYGGVAVSRKDLENEDEDDPFAPDDEADEEDPFARPEGDLSGDDVSGIPVHENIGPDVGGDSEIDSDEALGESDVERFKNFTFRGSKKNRMEPTSEDNVSGEDEYDDIDSAQSEEQSEEDSDLDTESDGEEDDNDDMDDTSSMSSEDAPQDPDRKALRNVLSSTAGLASALSAGANADVKKGHAVKKQRQTFDRLLDARIKLQKGVTAINDLDDAALSEDDVKDAARKAEDAALALWSTIDSIRCTILSAQDTSETTASRKRPYKATRSTPLAELWNHTQSLESTAHPLRRSTLDKWHAKTQPAIDAAPRSKLLTPSLPSHSRFTSVLDTYLTSEASKLVSSSTPTPGTFDDGTFYQSLLRDLITSRNADSVATAAASSEPFLPTKLKSKDKNKVVDTKASKGRKVRYTVHEKLENFMAPEDRSTWEDAARREFFASLFGNRGALDEAAEEGDEASDDENGAEVEALRLFRN